MSDTLYQLSSAPLRTLAPVTNLVSRSTSASTSTTTTTTTATNSPVAPPPVIAEQKQLARQEAAVKRAPTITPGSTSAFAHPAAAPALVLVVDDQVRNLQQVKKILAFDGYHVVTAESGEEALRCLASRRPDLILLDVMMPGMDGFDVCEHIKGNPSFHDIPIIFLSGDTEHQSVMTGFAKGGIDYIRKPFNKAELLARVRTHVELWRSQQRHAKQLQEKQRTLDLIAHEWHKPLQRISLILSKIKEMETGPKSAVINTLGTEAMNETERLLSSIENFLHHETPDAGSSALVPVTALSTEDLKRMAGKWYVTAKQKLIDLQLAAPTRPQTFLGPPFAVNQIVDAMLSNAVNFAPKNGRIDVRIFQEKERVCLRVQDDGPGFSTEYLRRKFQPYLRVTEGLPNRASALGVGLAAAKRIADRIQASLTVANRPGGGASVTVAFPSAAVAG